MIKITYGWYPLYQNFSKISKKGHWLFQDRIELSKLVPCPNIKNNMNELRNWLFRILEPNPLPSWLPTFNL